MSDYELPKGQNVSVEPAQLDAGAEARLEILLDQGIINVTMADVSRAGAYPSVPPSLPPHRAAGRSRRVSTRGGHPFPEPADSELDPNWNPTYTELTDSEKAEHRNVLDGPGHRQAAVASALAAFNTIAKRSEGQSVSYRLARERAAQEKHARQLGRR
jgi:hypothetical protein